MKTLYLDIFSGISGDMFLGAVLDLGFELTHLESELSKLKLTGYHLHAARKAKSSIEGVKFDVHLEHPKSGKKARAHSHGADHDQAHSHPHDHHDHEEGRNFTDIKQTIERSALSEWVKTKAVAVFNRVAVAEGKIHGRPPDDVHFHEVGAIDSIIDIVGACIALEWMGKPRVIASPVVEGHGWVDCAHGRFPIPTAATLEILGARGVPISQCEEPHELVTPTGAAILAEFVERFERMRQLVATKVGYGIGTRDNHTRPNVLRAALGDSASNEAVAHSGQPGAANDWKTDSIMSLETNLDDCTPEVLGYLVEKAFLAGALDVFHAPIQMKKNRPGVLLTILCEVPAGDALTELILRETTAFGVRRHILERRKLRRRIETVNTPYGEISVKIGMLNDEVLHRAPEFESCRQAALESKTPLQQVYDAAIRAVSKTGQERKNKRMRKGSK